MTAIADANARAQAIALDRSYCVRAPAGSGKTGLLINRMLAALSDVNYPEQVVAITFTRKAAAEIRNRLNDALQLAESDSPPPDEYTHQLWILARRLRQHSQERGWDLKNNPQRIRANTIDSLNRELAAQMPVLSGLGGSIRAVDDARELYRQALQQALQHENRSAGDTSWQESRAAVLSLGKNRLDSLLESLSPLLAQREHWAGLAIAATPSAVQASGQRLLNGWIRSSLSELDHALPRAPRPEWLRILQGQARCGETRWEALIEQQNWPGCEPTDLPAWQTLSRSLLTNEGQWRKAGGLNKRTGFPDPTLQKQAKQLLPEFSQSAPGLYTALHRLQLLPATYDPASAEQATHVLRVLKRSLGELRLRFASQSSCDHTEFALAARQALEGEDRSVAATADARFRHILVDEMQDTSNAQIALLETLVSDWQPGDGRSLFLVGDPQQSIYLFRHARVEKFNALLKPGARIGPVPLIPLNLQQNFRSDESLVAWTNLHIGAAFRTHNSPIDFAPSDATPTQSSPTSIHLYRHDDARSEAQEAELVIQKLLLDPSTHKIGVLARNRNHLRTLARQLRAAKIAFSGVELEALRETRPIRDYLAIVRVLHHPEDDFANLRLLRTPSVASSWAQLDELVAATPKLRWSARLRGDHRGIKTWPGLTKLQSALTQAEETLHRSGDLVRSARQLFHMLGLAESLNPAEHRDVQRFEQHLAAHCTQGMLSDEAAFERSLEGLWADTDAAAIELMTVHRSKGLEFDAVLILGMGRGGASSTGPLLRWHPDSGGDALALKPLPPASGSAKTAPSLYAWYSKEQNDAEDAERLRLLYVAVTRAKHSLHLFMTGKGGRLSLGHPLRDTLPWPDTYSPADSENTTRLEFTPHAEDIDLVDVRHPRFTQEPLHATECDLPLAPVTEAAPPSQLGHSSQSLAAENDAERLESSLIGTSVHEAFELLTKRGVTHWEQERETLLLALRAGLARRGLAADRRSDALEKINQLIEKALAGHGRMLLKAHRWHASELPISGLVEGRLVHGVIDRCFETTQGELWLVDYKTNSPPSNAKCANSTELLEHWHAELSQKYRDQLQRYAVLLERLRSSPRPARRMLYLVATDTLLELTTDGYHRL